MSISRQQEKINTRSFLADSMKKWTIDKKRQYLISQIFSGDGNNRKLCKGDGHYPENG